MMAGEVLEYDGADRHLRTTKGLNSVSYLRDVTDRIVGRVGNDGTQRYSHGVGGDTSSAVLDASSVVVQSTVSLPGGVMVTVAGATQTWSYPNLQGSVVATANAAGVKQGTSFFYDPFGNSVTAGALPDNSTGDLDYGYLGQYQRPVEHNVGLRQQAEMGARGYDAQLGRFLEVDPIEGGVDNDYGYVSDPRGSTDLDGECADVALSSVVLAEFAFSWRNVVDVATLECGIANGKGAYGWRHIRLSHWGGVLNASVKKLIKLVLKCARAHTVTPGRAGGGRAIWVVTAGFGLRFRIRGFEKKVPVGEVVVVLLKRKKSYTILTAYIKGNLLMAEKSSRKLTSQLHVVLGDVDFFLASGLPGYSANKVGFIADKLVFTIRDESGSRVRVVMSLPADLDEFEFHTAQRVEFAEEVVSQLRLQIGFDDAYIQWVDRTG
jgi:RHS repeat-associated protein